MDTASAITIRREKWPEHFLLLSDQYRFWTATVETLLGELGDQRVIDGLPLQGISYEPAGSQAGDVLIEAGDLGEPFITHRVPRPKAVRTAITGFGKEVDIELEASDGTITLVRLRSTPELPPSSVGSG
jgi:hypothetical protein